MSKDQEITDQVNAAVERARKDKDVKSPEEIKRDFFQTAAALFNEHVAGDVTLVDGRTMHIPEI